MKISKRDDISKYYNITQKILGTGATGVVCIGEKGGKQYAIKKIKKDKIITIKTTKYIYKRKEKKEEPYPITEDKTKIKEGEQPSETTISVNKEEEKPTLPISKEEEYLMVINIMRVNSKKVYIMVMEKFVIQTIN